MTLIFIIFALNRTHLASWYVPEYLPDFFLFLACDIINKIQQCSADVTISAVLNVWQNACYHNVLVDVFIFPFYHVSIIWKLKHCNSRFTKLHRQLGTYIFIDLFNISISTSEAKGLRVLSFTSLSFYPHPTPLQPVSPEWPFFSQQFGFTNHLHILIRVYLNFISITLETTFFPCNYSSCPWEKNAREPWSYS